METKIVCKCNSYDVAMQNESPTIFQKIGISLIVLGVVLGNTLYEIIGKSINLVNLFIFLGVLLLINYKNFLRLKFPTFTKFLLLPIFLQLYILLSLLTSDLTHLASGDSLLNDVFYIAFAISIIIALSTNDKKVKWGESINVLFAFSTITIFLISIIILSTTSFSFEYRYHFSSGADPLQMGIGLSVCFIVFLVYHPKNKFLYLVRIIDILAIIMCELAFWCRTGIFICIIELLLFLFQYIKKNRRNIVNIFKNTVILLLFVAMFIIVSYKLFPIIGDKINDTFDFMKRGFATFFGNIEYGEDASAAVRQLTKMQAKTMILEEQNVFKILFGQGYMTMYVDVPVLQAFLDFGVFGGLLYSVVVIVIPIFSIVFVPKSLKHNPPQVLMNQYMLFSLMSLTAIGKQLTSALPYGHDVYWGSIFCIYYACSFYNKSNYGGYINENSITWCD